ncbi:hypothetical protein EN879_32470, partial [Mesorhizobium sp. M7A.F.Ca.AU.002.02.1.1]
DLVAAVVEAGLIKKGIHAGLDNSGYKILAEYDTPEWAPPVAGSTFSAFRCSTSESAMALPMPSLLNET